MASETEVVLSHIEILSNRSRRIIVLDEALDAAEARGYKKGSSDMYQDMTAQDQSATTSYEAGVIDGTMQAWQEQGKQVLALRSALEDLLSYFNTKAGREGNIAVVKARELLDKIVPPDIGPFGETSAGNSEDENVPPASRDK